MSKNNTKSNAKRLLASLIDNMPENVHISIDALNDFVLPTEWQFTNRVNSNCHLALIKSGKGYYSHNGVIESFEPGKVFFFGKNTEHCRGLEANDLPRIVLLRFSLIDNATGKPIDHESDGHTFSYITNRISFIYEQVERLVTYYKEQTPTSKSLAELCLTQMIYEMYREVNGGVRRDPRLISACDYISQNYTEKLKLEDIVAVSGLTRNYFLKLFKATYNITPKQYQIQLKIEEASKYLLETDLKIYEIASLLGYEDQFSFSKQYKAVTHSTPSDIRKSYIEPGML